MNLVQIENVSKHFGDFTAVDNVSFNIEKGSVYGLLGPNGAGKTTTIRMIMNIIAPDSGAVIFDGNRKSGDFADQIGYLPEERGLYRKMKVKDVVFFMAELRGMDRAALSMKLIAGCRRWIWSNGRTRRLRSYRRAWRRRFNLSLPSSTNLN